MGFHAAGTAYYNSPSLFKNRERVPAKGYISDQLTDEAIGVVDRAKTLDQPFMLYTAYNAPHLPNDNPAPDQYQKQFISVVKQQITTTLPFILLIRV